MGGKPTCWRNAALPLRSPGRASRPSEVAVDSYRNVKALNGEMNRRGKEHLSTACLPRRTKSRPRPCRGTLDTTSRTRNRGTTRNQLEQADLARWWMRSRDEAEERDVRRRTRHGSTRKGHREGREEVDTMLRGRNSFLEGRRSEEREHAHGGVCSMLLRNPEDCYESVRTPRPESAQELWRVAGGIFKAGGRP